MSQDPTKNDARNENQAKPGRRLFQPGNPGGPGRPVGSRNSASIIAQSLIDDQGALLVQKAIEMALSGDSTAMRMLVDRLVPPTRERRISLSLPEVKTAGDIVGAIAAIMQEVANGSITPGEGQTLAGLVEAQRKSLETFELENRLRAIENKLEEEKQ
jgi:hypothetical protein